MSYQMIILNDIVSPKYYNNVGFDPTFIVLISPVYIMTLVCIKSHFSSDTRATQSI